MTDNEGDRTTRHTDEIDEIQRRLMVGNDVAEDMIAEQLGMKLFLLTDCLINKNNADISRYPHGSFDELFNFIHALER